MATLLPRFTGPANARQRMRLAAALGMLAVAAIATGGVASLTSEPSPPSEPEAPPSSLGSLAELPFVEPGERVEERVLEAEQALARARAAIREARARGGVDGRELDALERRLDAAAGRTKRPSAEAPDRRFEPSMDALVDLHPRPL